MRRRKDGPDRMEDVVNSPPDDGEDAACTEKKHPSPPLDHNTSSYSSSSYSTTYTYAKWLILRSMGCIYFIAFLGAYHQNLGLFGQNGLQPARLTGRRTNLLQSSFLRQPTLFWWIPLTDSTMRAVEISGLVLSAVVVVGGVNSWLIQVVLWLLDFSIVTIAETTTSFYSYGWESQVLETGFLTIFLCALPYLDTAAEYTRGKRRLRLALWETSDMPSSITTDPSPIILWLFRWLCFRISLGAGLIKLRGSSCWTDRTCLWYHFETQPIPSPLSWVYHFLPRHSQSQMVTVDLFVQVYSIALVLIPLDMIPTGTNYYYVVSRQLLRMGGVIQISFMLAIALSGNFAFLNHLTIIPALACIDDDFVAWMVRKASSTPTPVVRQFIQPARWYSCRRGMDIALLLWIGFLSWPVVVNLLQLKGVRQVMNTSYDAFRIVNTYGAFGSVGKARFEPIISVSDGGSNNTNWTELELPCKPGNVRRRPCFCAPYHYRMDWNIWFIGFKPHQAYLQQRETWMFALLAKILDPHLKQRPWLNSLDSTSVKYLSETYYNQNKAPFQIKVDMYRYQMNKSLWAIIGDVMAGRDAVWWKREYEETLIPAVTLDKETGQLAIVERR